MLASCAPTVTSCPKLKPRRARLHHDACILRLLYSKPAIPSWRDEGGRPKTASIKLDSGSTTSDDSSKYNI